MASEQISPLVKQLPLIQSSLILNSILRDDSSRICHPFRQINNQQLSKIQRGGTF